MARRDIEFDAEGVTLRGWFYTADGRPVRRPRSSWRTASRPSRRCTSTSTPRRSPRPGSTRWCSTTATSAPATASRARRSTRGRRCATTATRSPTPTTLPEVDADRIGVWGSQLLRRARARRRARSTAGSRPWCAQVPLVSGHDNFRALVRADFIDGFRADVRRRPRRPLRGQGARDGAGGRRGPARALRAADARTPTRGSPRPTSCARRRGATRSRCAASRCSPSTSRSPTSPYISPTPLLHDARAERRADPDRPGDRRVREGARAEEAA